MMYVASVVDKDTKELKVISMEYPTKKAYAEDLRANGYSVRFIATEETFDEECEKYYERKELKNRIGNMLYEADKKHAAKMGMTVKEYRRWLKA